MILLLLFALWQSPPAPIPGPAGSDPRYSNRYFEAQFPEGDMAVPKDGVVKIDLTGAVGPATCVFTGTKVKQFLDTSHAEYQTVRAEQGILHYKCTAIMRRHVKAVFYQGKWTCEPGWRPYDALADEQHPQACLEAWDGQEVPKEARSK